MPRSCGVNPPMTRDLTRLGSGLLFAVLVACGQATADADAEGGGARVAGDGAAGAEAAAGAPSGGRPPAVGGAAGDRGAAVGGGAGAMGGQVPELGGAASVGGAGGGPSSCDLVGCAPPPLCATGCSSRCGCCPCTEGDATDLDGVKHECVGGCWAPTDGACTVDGMPYGSGAEFAAGDGCNTCLCRADGTVECTALDCPDCNPSEETNRREYVSTDVGRCAAVDFLCAEATTPFFNDCGCGCEQDATCPDWIDCMPGGADPDCADLEALALRCPFTGVAW
jgi:hypothetical protein